MGERVNTAELKTQVIPSLLAGTARRTLNSDRVLHGGSGTDQTKAALRALALAAQALRFERPCGPATYSPEPPVHESRRIVPERVRRSLIRLLTTGKATEDSALAIAWTMDTVDEWMCILGEEDFVEALPLLRRSFSEFDGVSRRRLVEKIKQDRRTSGTDTRVTTEDNPAFAQALPLLFQILGMGAGGDS
jgi:hypothetical protein